MVLFQGEDAWVYYALMYTALAGIVTLVGVLFTVGNRPPKAFSKEKDFAPFPLVKKEIISHDTRKFTFGLPSGKHVPGLPVGQHISFRFTDETGKNHQRSYTPVTADETPGTVSFVIKVYKAGVHPKFPEGGKMSQHLDSLEIGQTLDMKGPKGHLDYLGGGKFVVHPIRRSQPSQARHATHIGMMAGGTGITPMLQVIQHILRNSDSDQTKISLLYANQSVDDILVRGYLDKFVDDYPERFAIHYTVDRAPPAGVEWPYSTGFISKEMVEKHLPAKASGVQIFMCGPPGMIKFACLPALTELGFSEQDWFIF